MENVLGQNIRYFRDKKRMTQQELAGMIGKEANTIARWERGKIQPKSTNIPLLAQALDVSPTDLLEDSSFRKKSSYEDTTEIQSSVPSMAYWGTLVDNAEKAAESGKNIDAIVNLVNIALNTLKSASKLVE